MVDKVVIPQALHVHHPQGRPILQYIVNQPFSIFQEGLFSLSVAFFLLGNRYQRWLVYKQHNLKRLRAKFFSRRYRRLLL